MGEKTISNTYEVHSHLLPWVPGSSDSTKSPRVESRAFVSELNSSDTSIPLMEYLDWRWDWDKVVQLERRPEILLDHCGGRQSEGHYPQGCRQPVGDPRHLSEDRTRTGVAELRVESQDPGYLEKRCIPHTSSLLPRESGLGFPSWKIQPIIGAEEPHSSYNVSSFMMCYSQSFAGLPQWFCYEARSRSFQKTILHFVCKSLDSLTFLSKKTILYSLNLTSLSKVTKPYKLWFWSENVSQPLK